MKNRLRRGVIFLTLSLVLLGVSSKSQSQDLYYLLQGELEMDLKEILKKKKKDVYNNYSIPDDSKNSSAVGFSFSIDYQLSPSLSLGAVTGFHWHGLAISKESILALNTLDVGGELKRFFGWREKLWLFFRYLHGFPIHQELQANNAYRLGAGIYLLRDTAIKLTLSAHLSIDSYRLNGTAQIPSKAIRLYGGLNFGAEFQLFYFPKRKKP